MGFFSRFRWAAVAVAVIIAQPSTARAHGANPRAWGIIVEPGNEKDMILRSDYLGFFRTEDGGKTWQYVCSNVYGVDSQNGLHVGMVIAPGGRVIVAPGDRGPLYISDDLCNWRQVGPFNGILQAVDVTLAGSDVLVLAEGHHAYDGGSRPTNPQIWRSSDKGDTWTRFGTDLPSERAPGTIAVAPSDPNRIYVSGEIFYDPNGGVVEVSKDGGTTWTESKTNTALPLTGTLRVDAIDPENPDVVFLWNDGLEDASGNPTPDEIWLTQDAGKNGSSSWSKAFQGTGDLPGFAFSPDLKTVLIAGQYDGVQTAAFSDVFANGQSAFHQQSADQVFGASWRTDGTLYLGGDDFKPPRCALCTSPDEGHSFKTEMTLCDVTFPTQCSASSTVDQVCLTHGATAGPWDDPVPGFGGFVQDYTQGDLCVGPTSVSALARDAGADASAGAAVVRGGESNGCAINVESRVGRSAPRLMGFFVAVAAALARRRRRR